MNYVKDKNTETEVSQRYWKSCIVVHAWWTIMLDNSDFKWQTTTSYKLEGWKNLKNWIEKVLIPRIENKCLA